MMGDDDLKNEDLVLKMPSNMVSQFSNLELPSVKPELVDWNLSVCDPRSIVII
jgi:hypothetical protein